MSLTQVAVDRDVKRLEDLIRAKALKFAPEGEFFTLASGRKSRFYFDAKYVTLAPESILTIGRLFWEQAAKYGATAVGGLAIGCIPISGAVVAYDAISGHRNIRGFYVRDQAKTHGTKESVYQAFDDDHEGGIADPASNVVIVDDVLTTGNSFSIAIDEVQRRGAKVSAIVVLVDRGEGGADNLRSKYGLPVIALFRLDEQGDLTYHGAEVH